MEYEIAIGLEVHVELNTATKIYCSCKNSFGGEANSQCCPICSGMPGALPVLNRKVVEYAIRMGHATECRIETMVKQARKNYFYPDLPKAYQISQFEIPLCRDGSVEIMIDGKTKKIGISEIHIEEDAGKLLHQEGDPYSLVDLNRCGVPLIEIVSKPDMHSSQEAKAFLETVRAILSYIGISDCKMQEGSIRCDVNVSVRPKGSSRLGTRCEMKNVNTFSGAQRAIDYEAARQIAILEKGGTICRETRRWDDEKGINDLLRSKEGAQDYRYFPEPDMPCVELSQGWIEGLKEKIPELPIEKAKRYMNHYGLSEKDAWQICSSFERAAYFDACVMMDERLAKSAANWLLGSIAKILNEKNMEIDAFSVRPDRLMKLLKLSEQGIISGTAAKKVLAIMINEPDDPAEIIEREHLYQNNNEEEIKSLVIEVLNSNPKAVEEYRNGRANVLGFLVGQCMRRSEGKGNPQIINKLLAEQLSNKE
ncbi:MAG: Asp-tRNA(Asn)/Glu-tRNA(Gln) amidotransferase subunit GatB [Clostridia bacterium]|nr:Asp-tRNA(Asn)/Glu-tRNA(Gln) amidotransferase subunit GatB [Clostridia bacterium]